MSLDNEHCLSLLVYGYPDNMKRCKVVGRPVQRQSQDFTRRSPASMFFCAAAISSYSAKQLLVGQLHRTPVFQQSSCLDAIEETFAFDRIASPPLVRLPLKVIFSTKSPKRIFLPPASAVEVIKTVPSVCVSVCGHCLY